MIRRGNHFLNLDGLGWVLIDGPWFHYLSRWGYSYVRLTCLEEEGSLVFDAEGEPSMATYSQVIWESVRWHPGTLIPEEAWWKVKVQQYIGRRTKYGWRVMPDGPLPAYLNKVEHSLEQDCILREVEDVRTGQRPANLVGQDVAVREQYQSTPSATTDGAGGHRP